MVEVGRERQQLLSEVSKLLNFMKSKPTEALPETTTSDVHKAQACFLSRSEKIMRIPPCRRCFIFGIKLA